MAQEPDVLAVLFTDVVGSTAQLSRLGDDAADALRRDHFALLRRAIGEHRGREVKSLGDGLMVAFASARDALACAASMQRAVAAQADEMELRVGIDAGEPIREGGDLFGTPVVVARRLCDAADGGEVLVSDLVRLLAARRAPDPLRPRGSLELKGLDQPVAAYEVRWRPGDGGARIRLCGGLAVESDGARLDERLPSRQARLLFGLLALNRRAALSRDALADALWSEDATPPSRDSSIRAVLTGVRRVFGPDSVQGRDWVRLELPDGVTIDVEEAEAALGAAEEALAGRDFDAAIASAQQAVELTAGELLAGLRARWIDERRGEVEELGLRALEIEAEAALAADRAAEAERAARRLIERAPYRESAYRGLMEALAARGNSSEATLTFDRLRALLREDLGTTPSAELVALNERLVAGTAPEATAHPALPGALARAARQPFVARTDELARVMGAWGAARDGQVRLALLAGEPGIGKTTLAAAFATAAHADGATVLLGRCHAEALVPYEPFAEALRQLPDAVTGSRAPVLARVMPELGVPPADADDTSARYVLFEAIARTLAEVAAAAPVVLVLEDLHWADDPTLLLLRHVARACEHAAIMILATYRSTEVPGTERVTAAVADLERELPIERVSLAGLSDDDVGELIGALDGRRPSVMLGSAMRRDTAGNPLFVAQLLRHLTETGAVVDRGGELRLDAVQGGLGVPDDVKELVGRRLAALGDETVSALRIGAAIGRGFDDHLVAAVEGLPAESILDALEVGTAAGLVEEGAGGRHAFVHALVRDAIYEQTGAARRALLHRRVADALEAADGEPAELALHFLAAGADGKGIEYSVVAAERALTQLAYEDAAAHYGRAIDALRDTDPERRCQLLEALGAAEARGGRTSESKLAYLECARLADELGLSERLAHAAIGYGGRILWEVSRDDPHLVPLLERALAVLGDEHDVLRVQLLARLAGGPLRDATYPPERRHAASSEAVDLARRIGDPATLAYAIDGYIAAHHSPDHTPAQVDLSTELIDLARAVGDKERMIEGYEDRCEARIEMGDLTGARADCAAVIDLARELRQPAQAWQAAEISAQLALLEGDLDEAERRVHEAVSVGEHAQAWNAAVTYRLQLSLLRRLQGRLAEVEDLLREAAEQNPTYPVCRCVLVQALAELGHEDEARATLAELMADDIAALPYDECWLFSLCVLGEAAAALGERDHCDTLYRRLLPWADRVAVSTPELAIGSVSYYLGLVAEPDHAARHFSAALAMNERIGARPWAERARRALERAPSRTA